MAGCEFGPEGDCGRESVRRVDRKPICQSHRRMWLAGKPLDTPVRGYQRMKEGPDGEPVRASLAPPLKRKPAPFAAELELLKSLGLR